ncbi:MAG: hypothetical protein RL001_155, partial [Pseudomonadota bacterium]
MRALSGFQGSNGALSIPRVPLPQILQKVGHISR